MPSPFPGMDPWLEDRRVFPGVHDMLIVFLNIALNRAMPESYQTSIKNRVYLDDDRQREPDIGIYRPTNGHARMPRGVLQARGNGGLLVLEGVRVPEEVRDTYIEVYADRGKRLVTAIEILSPGNKKPRSNARKSYSKKQREFLAAEVNLVEVDLLRAGKYSCAFPEAKRPPGFDYLASVVNFQGPHPFGILPMVMTKPLPALPIPLDDEDEVSIPLQPLLDSIYDDGKLAGWLDYTKPCDPPLSAEQHLWADAILAARGGST